MMGRLKFDCSMQLTRSPEIMQERLYIRMDNMEWQEALVQRANPYLASMSCSNVPCRGSSNYSRSKNAGAHEKQQTTQPGPTPKHTIITAGFAEIGLSDSAPIKISFSCTVTYKTKMD